MARGADAVLSFQWRAAATGAEKFHSGMVPHAGTDSRVWREVVEPRRGRCGGSPRSPASRVPAEAALLLDWESWWALELDSHPSSSPAPDRVLGELYRPLLQAGVNADFAHPESDLSGYRLVLVPALYLVTDAGAENVRRFVADGGTALITFFSGIVDPQDRVRLGGYPAPWRDLLGLRIEELAPLPAGRVRPPGRPRPGRRRCNRCRRPALAGRSSSSAGRIRCSPSASGHLDGQAAVTRHEHGRGTAFYLGTLPDRATLGRLVGQACQDAGVTLGPTCRPAWRRYAAATTSS